MNRWERFKDWIAEPIGRKHGMIKCDICGEWGTPNPNYLVPTFVHISKKTGSAFMHQQHVVRHVVAQLRRDREKPATTSA